MAETAVLNYSPRQWQSEPVEGQGSNRIRSLIRFYEELTREVQRQSERLNPPQPRFLRHRRLPTSEDRRASLILGSPTSPSQLKTFNEACCAICGIEFEAEEFEAEEDLRDKKQLECKHVFHYKCIFRWTKRQNTCPLCRRPFDYRWRAQSSSSSPSMGFRSSIRPFLGERM